MSKKAEEKRVVEKFTKREWIFSFIIAAIVQGAVWYIAFVNAGNPSALTYVSFAGTLISIILAVLAIGYTYGESVSQKNKSDSVASQISSLNEVIRNVKIETDSLNQISDISNDLKGFHENFKGEMKKTHDDVGEIKKAINLLHKGNQVYDKDDSDDISTKFSNDDIFRIILRRGGSDNYIALLMVFYASLYDDEAKFFLSTLNELEDKYSESGLKTYTLGLYTAIISILRGSGVIVKGQGFRFRDEVEFSSFKKTSSELEGYESWERDFIEVLFSKIEDKISD